MQFFMAFVPCDFPWVTVVTFSFLRLLTKLSAVSCALAATSSVMINAV